MPSPTRRVERDRASGGHVGARVPASLIVTWPQISPPRSAWPPSASRCPCSRTIFDPAGLKERLRRARGGDGRGRASGTTRTRPAKVGAEHTRTQRRLDAFTKLQADAEDLDGLAELAEEDPDLAGGARGGDRLGRGAPRRRSRSSGCSPATTTPGDALVTVNAGAGGTDAQDWAEMVLRMEMRWAERRGFKVELLEASAGEEAGIKSATFRVSGENAYGLYSAEKGVHRLVRLSPFDSANRRQTSFAGVEVAPVVEEAGDDRDRRRRPAGRHLPRLRRRRPARQQDRLGGAHHPPADGHRRAVPERALAVGQPRDRDGDAALQADRAPGARAPGGDRRASAARRRTSTSARRSAPTCCTRTRWSRTTAPTSRSATPTACSTATSTGSSAPTWLEANAKSAQLAHFSRGDSDALTRRTS